MNLQGKTALVTGGATGLGFSITKLLLAKGMKVAICARTQVNLDQAKSQLNSNQLSTYVCDISDYPQVETMVKQIGSIDVLVNCAGVWIEGNLEDNTPQAISQATNSNLKGMIFVTKAVLPTMRSQRSGYIVNIISKSGVKINEGQSVYTAVKHGAMAFTKSLILDLRGTGVKVIGIYPTGMNVPQFFQKASDKHRNYSELLDPNEVAEVIVFALEREDPMVLDHIELDRSNK